MNKTETTLIVILIYSSIFSRYIVTNLIYVHTVSIYLHRFGLSSVALKDLFQMIP